MDVVIARGGRDVMITDMYLDDFEALVELLKGSDKPQFMALAASLQERRSGTDA